MKKISAKWNGHFPLVTDPIMSRTVGTQTAKWKNISRVRADELRKLPHVIRQRRTKKIAPSSHGNRQGRVAFLVRTSDRL